MFFSINKRTAVPCAIYHDDDDSAILVHVLRVRPITKARVHVEGSERSPLYRPPARPSDRLSLSFSLRSLHTTRHTAVVERTPRKEFRLYLPTSPSVGGGAPTPYSGPTRSTDLFMITGYTTL